MNISPLTIGKNAVKKESGDLLAKTSTINWSNKYLPPTGYSYNDEGWLQTAVPLPYYNVMIPTFVGKHITPASVFLQDLLILTHLNNKPLHILTNSLRNLFEKYGYTFSDEDIDKLQDEVIDITTLIKPPPAMEKEIFRYEDLWIAPWCTLGGRAQVKAKKRNDKISEIRSFMEVSKKYITQEVMKDAQETRYAVDLYWKSKGWTKQDRTRNTVLESIHELHQLGVETPTQKEIAVLAGLSIPTVSRRLNTYEK